MTDITAKPLHVTLPIGILAAAAFLSSGGSRVVDPLLHVIATDFRTTVPAVSIIVAAYSLPYGICQIFLGPLGDRVGKLRLLLVALLGYAVATAGCAMAVNLPALTLMRVAAGAASAGLIPIAMAYIGDAVPYAERQVTLSRFLNGAVLAMTLAGPVGGMFGEFYGWRGVFVLLSFSALGVAAVLALRLRDLPDPCKPEAGFSIANYMALLRFPFARHVLVATLLDGILLVGCFPFLAPYMREAFDLPYAAVGGVLACFGLGAMIYVRLAKRLVALLGEPGMVLTGALVIAAALALGMQSPDWEAFIFVEAALGFGFFLLHGVLQARATEILPSARATAVAGFVFMLFMGQALGALLVGTLIARFGYQTAITIDAAGVLLLGLLLWPMLRRAR